MTPAQLYIAARIAFGWRFTALPLSLRGCFFTGATREEAIAKMDRAFARHILN